MADEVCNQIDETIKNFTDEKIGSISEFQRITDEASNKQYYNDTYQNFRYTCDSLHDLKYPIEDLVNDSISDEDAELVVTKLEELISAEKPLFDHFHTYYNYQTEVFYPWKNISPTGDTSPECYGPGHFPDLFDYHNLAWKEIGQHLYKVPSVQQQIYDDVTKFEDYEYTGRDLKWNP